MCAPAEIAVSALNGVLMLVDKAGVRLCTDQLILPFVETESKKFREWKT